MHSGELVKSPRDGPVHLPRHLIGSGRLLLLQDIHNLLDSALVMCDELIDAAVDVVREFPMRSK